MQPLKWNGKSLLVLDQTLLPEQEIRDDCDTYELVAEAIEKMKVRGAPAIGATAAYGIAIGANASEALDLDKGPYLTYLESVCERLAKTRPTAVNLFWAIKRMRGLIEANQDLSVKELAELITREANLIAEEDVRLNKSIGQNGLTFIPENARILTHCNTGSLATFDYGTALGVIRAAHEKGRVEHVFADETRPYLQGARLTAFELHRDNIPVSVVTDSMAGYLMQQKMVDLVIVGADRIAANGDAANKIGTYSLAVLAKHHGIPFYVAAPMSTLDYEMETGAEIEIEQRSADEVIFIGGKRMVPEGVPALHPAFDVTPHELITAIITDKGNVEQPNTENMLKLL
ncbi:S-methyl-5-thioribose-1-phosphate isomerase [Tumebacillus sp. ITR2]|uniref:Methylthioribose-1-phosphate isomerase n=1 Tax=Tumebacillus amylolyticus TaxID=2801339 RepID=A0ABS1JE71_9BACL|nr:S-methyl-5-thioribose-1-phosphate isomerase [Tumebacillus amylolyticus]MBL0388576.1 S-methyl-5-thioribose-1-phosphate isomerase [Tumebacillus amylolyticus]